MGEGEPSEEGRPKRHSVLLAGLRPGQLRQAAGGGPKEGGDSETKREAFSEIGGRLRGQKMGRTLGSGEKGY